jgi:hypothetical protein
MDDIHSLLLDLYDNLLEVDIRKDVRFQVLTAAAVKMTAFWDIALCSLVEVDRCFIGAYYLYYQGYYLSRLVRDYTALYPRRLSS